MAWREKRRAKKIRRLEDRLADAEDNLHEWGFSMAPSERRWRQEKIERLEVELAALTPDNEGEADEH